MNNPINLNIKKSCADLQLPNLSRKSQQEGPRSVIGNLEAEGILGRRRTRKQHHHLFGVVALLPLNTGCREQQPSRTDKQQ